jgi:hypothetical protein
MKHILGLAILLISIAAASQTNSEFRATKYGFGYYVNGDTSSVSPIPPVEDTSIRYGLFVLSTPTYPTIAARTTRTKYILSSRDSQYFRYNWVVGDVYRVPQLHDSGVAVALTVGFANTNEHADFPTDTTAWKNSLRAIFDIDKPEMLFVVNEPGNFNYWNLGTTGEDIMVAAYRYVNLLKASITVAKEYNIRVYDGGMLFYGVYHYWRYLKTMSVSEGSGSHVYKDSLQWLIDATGINTISGSYAQSRLTWCDVVFPQLALLDVNAVNVHWYEPLRGDTTNTVVSRVFTAFAGYMQNLTGKEIITHEFGTDNHSQALLNGFLDELKQRRTKIQIYFAGTATDETIGGGKAVDLSDYYKAWLEQ